MSRGLGDVYKRQAKYNELQKKLAANKILKEKNLAIKQEEQLRAEALKALAKEAAEVKLEGSEENQKL